MDLLLELLLELLLVLLLLLLHQFLLLFLQWCKDLRQQKQQVQLQQQQHLC